MKVTTLDLTVFSILLASANALNLVQPRANPRVLGYDLHRRDASPFASQVGNDFVILP
jgi:hypothetical protein